jgi:hypothetical protein
VSYIHILTWIRVVEKEVTAKEAGGKHFVTEIWEW